MPHTNTVRRNVPVNTSELLSRLGRAKTLARDHNVTHVKYAPAVWDAHIQGIVQATENLASATRERLAFGQTAFAVVPQASQLVARLRYILLGQLPPGHPDLQGELAQYLAGRSGPVVQKLAALWQYCKEHADSVPLSPDLVAQHAEDIIADLRAHDPDMLQAKRAAEQDALNMLKQLENTAWNDLKQVRAFAQAEYEAGEPAIAQFAELSKIERASVAPVAPAEAPTVIGTPQAV